MSRFWFYGGRSFPVVYLPHPGSSVGGGAETGGVGGASSVQDVHLHIMFCSYVTVLPVTVWEGRKVGGD